MYFQLQLQSLILLYCSTFVQLPSPTASPAHSADMNPSLLRYRLPKHLQQNGQNTTSASIPLHLPLVTGMSRPTQLISDNRLGTNLDIAGLDDTPENRGNMVEAIPLRRMCKASDVGNVVCFLCSDEADYITGLRSLLMVGGLFEVVKLIDRGICHLSLTRGGKQGSGSLTETFRNRNYLGRHPQSSKRCQVL